VRSQSHALHTAGSVDIGRSRGHNANVKRIKVTPELRDRAWQDFYERHRRVLTLTEGQRRYISRVTARKQPGKTSPA
jgi:hypothetical protein